jgi:alpha-mannosidase
LDIDPMDTRRTIHLIPNAHLDLVWLWRLDEGLQAGIATDLLRE